MMGTAGWVFAARCSSKPTPVRLFLLPPPLSVLTPSVADTECVWVVLIPASISQRADDDVWLLRELKPHHRTAESMRHNSRMSGTPSNAPLGRARVPHFALPKRPYLTVTSTDPELSFVFIF